MAPNLHAGTTCCGPCLQQQPEVDGRLQNELRGGCALHSRKAHAFTLQRNAECQCRVCGSGMSHVGESIPKWSPPPVINMWGRTGSMARLLTPTFFLRLPERKLLWSAAAQTHHQQANTSMKSSHSPSLLLPGMHIPLAQHSIDWLMHDTCIQVAPSCRPWEGLCCEVYC